MPNREEVDRLTGMTPIDVAMNPVRPEPAPGIFDLVGAGYADVLATRRRAVDALLDARAKAAAARLEHERAMQAEAAKQEAQTRRELAVEGVRSKSKMAITDKLLADKRPRGGYRWDDKKGWVKDPSVSYGYSYSHGTNNPRPVPVEVLRMLTSDSFDKKVSGSSIQNMAGPARAIIKAAVTSDLSGKALDAAIMRAVWTDQNQRWSSVGPVMFMRNDKGIPTSVPVNKETARAIQLRDRAVRTSEIRRFIGEVQDERNAALQYIATGGTMQMGGAPAAPGGFTTVTESGGGFDPTSLPTDKLLEIIGEE